MKRKLLKTAVILSALMTMVLGISVSVWSEEIITPVIVETGSETMVSKSIRYTEKDKLQEDEVGVIVPIKITEEGVLEINYGISEINRDCKIYLYNDSTLKNKVYDANLYYGARDGVAHVTLYKGTYYFKFSSKAYSSSSETFVNDFKISMRLFSRGERTIKAGKKYTYYRESVRAEYLFKYKAGVSGKVTISVSDASQIIFSNSSKKDLTDKRWVHVKDTFTVKKGQTYYFRVFGDIYISPDRHIQTIKITESKVKAKSGKSKKKAVAIKYNKTGTCFMAPGDRTSKWYKITLKKGKRPAFILNSKVFSGKMKILIRNKKGRVVQKESYSGRKVAIGSYGKKWKKGTYYIEIKRENSKSSGILTIKNKQE